MLSSINDLLIARPHECSSVHLAPADFQVYQKGYYRGVVMALQVAEAAVRRYRLVSRTLRAERRQPRSA